MRRLGLLLAIAALAVAAAAPAAQARSSYCSPTGDYCIGIMKRDGHVLLRISTFSFTGRYRLCVRAPDNTARCKRFRLFQTRHGIYRSTKSWGKHFPNKGAGTYRVRWQKFGSNLGPRLSFTR